MKHMLMTTAAAMSLLISTAAWSQPRSSADTTLQFRTTAPRVSSFHIMPTISIGSSSVAGAQGSYQYSAATNYEAGVLMEFGRGGLVFQTGALYMRPSFVVSYTQANFYGSNSTYKGEAIATASYLGLPLAMKYRLRISNGVRLAGRLGVVPALLMGFSEEGTSTITTGTSVQSSTWKADNTFNGFNAFGVAGLGPEFRLSADQNMRVEANYERGLLGNLALQSINLMASYGMAF